MSRLSGLRGLAARSCAALAVLLLFLTPGHAGGAGAPAARYLVLIVLDGFRPDYLQLAPMPNLRALMRAGMVYRRAWVGQLETETPTGHATIATGVYPRKNGVIGFGWRGPNGGYSWMPTNLAQLDAGDMEAIIESGGAPTISDLMHRTYPGSKSVSLSGEKYYAADAMGTGADYILYGKSVKHGMTIVPIGRHVPPPSTHYQSAGTSQVAYAWVQDQTAGRLAAQMLRTTGARTMLVNLPGTDIWGHESGGIIARTDMRREDIWADNAIGTIVNAYKRAGLYRKTLFVVTADHGMLPNTRIVPIKRMYAAIRATGAQAIEDDLLTTAGYVFLQSSAAAPSVAARLAADHFPGVEGALYKVPVGDGYAFRPEASSARSWGPALTAAYTHLADTVASTSGPDVILPYAEDTMGLTVKGQKHWGNHGGLSWRTQHIPLILSGPGVAHGTSWFPAQLVDIAPTIERLMGVPIPGAVDGVVLADAERNSSRVDSAAERALGPGRSADVRALMQHSRAQHGIALGL